MHTHAHVLDIVSRQKALNFTPGTNWSYSNTGYNLSAIIVSRVSGQSFADFSRDRIFKPLGMTRTSWRDDFTRIVKHRAIAYAAAARTATSEDMPFENVHGNGGLLTTVGDLLRWNENFVVAERRRRGVRGGAADARPLHRRASRTITRSASTSATYRGVREVSHSGSTAGYRAFLTRYPGSARLGRRALQRRATRTPRSMRAPSRKPISVRRCPAPRRRRRCRRRTRRRSHRAAVHARPSDLAAYPGRYVSDEAEMEF